MATAQRHPDPDLSEQLKATRFADGDDFFELVRNIERLSYAATEEELAVAVGCDGPPAAEPIRFHVAQGQAFPGRAVARTWRQPTSGNCLEVDVTFFGLTGPSGALPPHYGNLIQARLKQRDSALADFLDLFNHRLIALYYRAWAKYRPTIQYEQRLASDSADAFTQALNALAGQHLLHDSEPRRYYSGHFARRIRSASDLARLIGDFIAAPVYIDGFSGQWIPIAVEHRLRIGTKSNGCNNRLGEGVMAGGRTWDMQSKFAIEIGAIDDDHFAHIGPRGERFTELCQLIESYAPAHLDIELRYLVAGTRRSRLGRALQLGRNCWLQRDAKQIRTARIQLRRARGTA